MKPLVRPRFLLAGCGVLLLGIPMAFAFLLLGNACSHRRSVRGSFSLVHHVLRRCDDTLQAYWRDHGSFPPEPDGRHFYGPFLADVYTTYPLDVQMREVWGEYTGPAIDPWRHERLFDGETRGKVRYTGSRNPESDKMPGAHFYGYPLRYFRWPEATAALLLVNGPDEDIDVDERVLVSVPQPESFDKYRDAMVPYRYDPTNGTVSSGDVFRVVTPRDYDW
jgi:hypothetical protein